MPARLQRAFPVERGKRIVRFTTRQAQQSLEPVQRDRRKSFRHVRLARCRREPGIHFALGLPERVPGDEDGGGERMGHRTTGQQRQYLMRSPQSLVAPRAVRQPQLMPPVVRLEGDGMSERCHRVVFLARSLEDEAERRECLAVLRVHAARVAGVSRRHPQGIDVWHGVSTARLERERTGVGETHVHPRVCRMVYQQLFEGATRVGDATARERLECGAPFGEAAVRGQYGVEICLVCGSIRPRHHAGQAVAEPMLGEDGAGRVCGGQRAAKPDHGLRHAVVFDSHVWPAHLRQLLFRHDLTGVCDQHVQQAHAPRRNLDDGPVAKELSSLDVEPKRTEGKPVCERHEQILRSGGSDRTAATQKV